MTTRRGFTLIELLIGLVLISILGVVVYRTLLTIQRSSRRQAEQTNLQANVRMGALIVPAELQEIGFDSSQAVAGPAAVTSDLLEINANRIRFRAMRGVAITCDVAGGNELRVRRPTFGLREPVAGDNLLLFVERNQGLAADDEWILRAVTAVDASTCGVGAEPALRLTLATPINGGLLASILVGAPVRIFEPMEFALYVADGRSWLGTRSSVNDPYEPVIGPLADGDGFALRYFNNAGTQTADLKAVRTIEITLHGRSDEPVTVASGSAPRILDLNLTTRVALRNTLRP